MTALAVSACTGDDNAAPTTTLAPITIPDPTTSTTTVTTTEPVIATTSTTDAGPTTTITEAAAKQAVITAAIASWEAFNEAKLDPTNDGKVAAMASTRAGEALNRATQVIASYRVENHRSVTNSAIPAEIIVSPDSVQIDLADSTATIEYCNISSNIVVEVGGNPDGTDRVLDSTVNSFRERDTFKLLDHAWTKTDGKTLAEFEGATACPDQE